MLNETNMDMATGSRSKTIVRTSIIGILGNIVLVAIKATFGLIAGSIAIVMDALNNLTDALSSLITIIGTKLSGKAPDKEHPFGHGRIEYLTSMLIGIIILVAGGSAIVESIKALVELYSGSGELPDYSNITLIVVSIAIVFKFGLGMYFRKMGKKTSSDALKASGTDALTDCILSISTLVCGLITRFSGVALEGWFGIAIGLFILKSGIDVLKEGASEIIGSRTEASLITNIKKTALSYEGVQGVYDLIVNEYGHSEANGSLHIQVRDDMTAQEIHHLSKKIIAEIYLKYNVTVTVGIYASNDSGEYAVIKHDLLEILRTFDNLIQMHGFYVDFKEKVITFDLIFSFDEKEPLLKCEEAQNKLKEKYKDYSIVAVLDKDYTD